MKYFTKKYCQVIYKNKECRTNRMKLGLLYKTEFRRLVKSKTTIIFPLTELFGIVISHFSITGSQDSFSTLEIYISSYFGIMLALRYLYTAMLVSILFSNDMNNGIYKTYIAVRIPRTRVWGAKMLCGLSLLLINILSGSSLYFIFGILTGEPLNSFGEFYMSIILSIFPMGVFMLLIVFIDMFFSSSPITMLFSTFAVLIAAFIPSNIAKWVFISYNNPIIVVLFQGSIEIFQMIVVMFISLIIMLMAVHFFIKHLEIE